jgi:hypothetical protein
LYSHSPKKQLPWFALPRHSNAGEIKRHPEVEALLVPGDSRTEVMKRALDWLIQASSPLTGEDAGEGDTKIALVSTLTAVLQLPATQ